jgi:hypothetical protein
MRQRWAAASATMPRIWFDFSNDDFPKIEAQREEEANLRSILLLLLGVPIPIVILIGLFSHF